MKKPLSIINDTFCTNGGPMELMLSWMWMGDKQVGQFALVDMEHQVICSNIHPTRTVLKVLEAS